MFYYIFSIFPDNNADILPASLLTLHCSFPCPILSSIVMVSFYILSKRFFLKYKGKSDAKVASATKKEYGLVVHIFKVHKVLKVNF